MDYLYLFRGSSTGLQAQASWTFKCPHRLIGVVDSFGPAGDVNGDGCGDVYLSAHIDPRGAVERASVLVFYGSPNGLPDTPNRQFQFEDPVWALNLGAAWLAMSTGTAATISSSATRTGAGARTGRGECWCTGLAGGGPPARPSRRLPLGAKPAGSGSARWQLFGSMVASAGDIDHDGFDDVLISAPFAGIDDLREGLVFVYHGSPSGLERQPWRVLQSGQAHAMLGGMLCSGGDVNGDGFADVLVGAEQLSEEYLNQGGIALFLGSRNGLSRSPQWSLEGEDNHWRLGEQFYFAGDVNGDGYDDVLIADQHFTRGGEVVGPARLFHGSPQALTGSANWQMKKPFLVALQGVHDRTPPLWKWLGALALLGLAVGLFLLGRRAQARQRSNAQRQAREQERERLARDMHDHLGATLSQIALWSELTKSANTSPEKVGQNLDRISQSARSALDSMNDLVSRFRSPWQTTWKNQRPRRRHPAQESSRPSRHVPLPLTPARRSHAGGRVCGRSRRRRRRSLPHPLDERRRPLSHARRTFISLSKAFRPRRFF